MIKYGLYMPDYPEELKWRLCSWGSECIKDINQVYKELEMVNKRFPTITYIVKEYDE